MQGSDVSPDFILYLIFFLKNTIVVRLFHFSHNSVIHTAVRSSNMHKFGEQTFGFIIKDSYGSCVYLGLVLYYKHVI